MFKMIKEHRSVMCKTNKACARQSVAKHGGKKLYCNHCKRLNVKLCRKYHVLTNEKESSQPDHVLQQLACQEIIGRLLYEFVFDILSEEDLLEDKWMRVKRDWGHTKRLQKLVRIACIF